MLYDAAHADDTFGRDVSLLRAWGVFHYALCGSTDCELCHSPVRLAIPITSEHFNGESVYYTCLCTNCAFEELERARCIILQVGRARVEYFPESVLSS